MAALALTALAVCNELGPNLRTVVQALRGRPSSVEPHAVFGRSSSALLEECFEALKPEFLTACRRWGPSRVAVIVCVEHEDAPAALGFAEALGHRGLQFALSSGRVAGAQALVSASGLISSKLADAVLVGGASVAAASAAGLCRPLCVHAKTSVRGAGAAWVLLERQADAETRLAHADDGPRLDRSFPGASLIVLDAIGEPLHDQRSQVPSSAPWIALSGHFGDLGCAAGITHAVIASASICEGFIPGTRGCASGEALDRRVVCQSRMQESDLIACDFGSAGFTIGVTSA